MFIDDDESATDYANVLRAFSQKIGELEAQGYKVTSRTRSVSKNRKVGGGERSQHLIGTAADFEVPENIPAFVAAARARGLRVVPELTRPGHGPHLHVQLYAKGQAPLAFYRAAGVIARDI